jgi:hypothetical protein
VKEEQKRIDEEIAELERELAGKDIARGTALTILRVSGYARPVQHMNIGKQQEVSERLCYEVS